MMSVMVMSDSDVWNRVRFEASGPDFAQLYEAHSDRVYSHLRRRDLDRPVAEDITGDTFVETWRQRSTIVIGPDDTLLPWLLAVANNLLRKHWRQQGVQSRAFARMPTEHSVPDPTDEYVDAEGDRYAVTVIYQVLDHLGEQDREVIEMCVVEGLSPGSVAAALLRRSSRSGPALVFGRSALVPGSAELLPPAAKGRSHDALKYPEVHRQIVGPPHRIV